MQLFHRYPFHATLNRKATTLLLSAAVTLSSLALPGAIYADTEAPQDTAADSQTVTQVETLTVEPATYKLYINHKKTFKFYVNGTASNWKVRWKSSKSSVASVTQSGKVTAKKKGSATIYAVTKDGRKAKARVTVPGYKKVKVPNVLGKSEEGAVKALKKAGLKGTIGKASFMTEDKLQKTYPRYQFADVVRQSQRAGRKISENSTVTVSIADEIPYEGTGVEAMVRWAEDIAEDDRFGYSLGVYLGRNSDRFDPFLFHNASQDFDCASLVNAALAHSGMGKDFITANYHPPIVGGVVTLLKRNDWKMVKYKGKKPPIRKLKRGDILVNPSYHIEIYSGDGMDVGAHYDWDRKTGDSSGEEINIRPTKKFSHGYTAVYRYYGDIEDDLADDDADV